MKSVHYRRKTLKLLISSLNFVLLFSFQLFAQEADVENGKKLYNANCAACHKLEGKLIGPALKGITEKREEAWLIAWIRDNESLRASGDKDAIAIYAEYNKLPMVAYPQFSDQDIKDILAYTDDKPVEKIEGDAAAVATAASLGIDSMQVVTGKKIYNANCAACHKLEGKLIGPALGDVQDRRTDKWLRAWIRDNAALRASGDADAIAIYEEYNGSPMMAFPQLSDADLDAILAYTKHVEILEPRATDVAEISNIVETEPIPWATYIVVLVLAIAVFWVFFKSKNEFVKLVTVIALLLVVGYLAYWAMMSIGNDQGYKPVQPIAFSHKIHSGDNKIDCQYCHSSAKHSKHSGIPSVNVCMNCHIGISEYNGPVTAEFDKAFYDGEIQKIYDAVGWDKEENQYIAGYERKPIEWIRIHNLPDFAYFNHAQHVTVGGVACQTCHGPVEEMEELEQHSPLTMGWCINCHRESEVKVEDNAYYEKIHEELSKKYGVEKVTVAQMGGMECGKCHY